VTQRQPWDVLVGEMLARRLTLTQIEPQTFPESLFGVRATDADIADAESRLGHPLDAQHAAILREGDGWPSAFAFGDILSTHELGTGRRWDRAQQMLSVLYEDGPADGFPPRGSVYPIHVADTSVFVIDLAGPATDGGHPVYWLSSELLGDWENAHGYWLAGLELLERLRRQILADPFSSRAPRPERG
jgi:hypothetical protein